MSATGTSTITAELRQTLASGQDRPSDVTITASLTDKVTWGSGDGSTARTIDLVAYQSDTIASGSPSTPVNHDLQAIDNLAGVAVDFAHVRFLFSHVDSGPDNVEVILGASTDPFESEFLNGTSAAVEMQDEGAFMISKPQGTAGFVVTTGQDTLKFDAGTTAESTVVKTMYAGND